MEINSNSENKSKPRRLPSLIKLWYYYPITLVSITLILILAFFIFIQIKTYETNVKKLKAEFPINQRNELKIKILTVKDYIFWVKTNEDPQISEFVSKKLNSVQRIIESYSLSDSNFSLKFNLLIDSITELNKNSAFKLIIMDDSLNFLNQPAVKIDVLTQVLSKYTKNLHFLDYTEPWKITDELFEKSSLKVFYRKSSLSDYSIGFYLGDSKKDDILKEIVLDSLSRVKYHNNEYIFINTFEGNALLTKGKRSFHEENIIKSNDSNWKQVFNKELEFAQKPGGDFLTYQWSNNQKHERKEKTSFFTGDLEWKWIIGTGFFTDDIKPLLNTMKSDLQHEITTIIAQFLAFLGGLTLLIFLLTRRIASRTNKNIQLFLNFFKRASQGLQVMDTNKLAFQEFELLAEAANHMISEREKIKSVLANEKSKLRYIIDAIPDLIFFKNTNSLFEGCNTAFEKYTGKTSSEIVGMSEYDLFKKERADCYIESDKRIFSLLLSERTTEWVTLRNGEKRLMDTLKTPFYNSDKVLLGIIGISRDITEMEETRQRLLLAKEKAEESDRLKTAFLANMSHEIRTPMNAIIGFSDLLSDDELSAEDRLDFISKIKSSGNALMSLINDIIDIAKIEAGQLRISESELNLNKLMKELHSTFTNLKNLNGKEKISLEMSLGEEENTVWIFSDPFRLQQILTNLLNNALKFTEFGKVEFGYSIEDAKLRFFVKDTGIGILRSKQKLLFKRFSQIDSGANRKYGGTGLGLAISSNLVELLGGTIDVDSFPGKGSTFTFTIPYKPITPQIAKKSNARIKDPDWSGKTILIAEDSMQNYLLVEAILRFTQVKLIHALDGQKVINLAKSESGIDLILMDIQLPVKTGYEALVEIRELFPTIPVISYTAFALPNERDKSIKAGFVDYLPKPIKAETLIPILDKYLSKPGLENS